MGFFHAHEEVVTRMASRIQGITVEIGGDTTKLSKALEGVNKSIKGTQSGLKDVNKLLKLDPSNTELVVQKQKMLKDAIEATKEKLATLKTAAQQANEQLANGEITQQQYDAFQREIAETEQNLKSLQEQAATTNATLAKIDEAGEKLQNLGSSVENVGKKFLPVTAAVTGLGTAAVKTAADFDAEMSKVSAISGATGADFDKLRAKAREMGAKTKFSATEAVSAMEYMAMAGWRTEDMLSGIEGIMNLAAASGEDLATTSDIVTDALTAFGLSASDSGHFADILAAASSNANTNVSMMGETFKYCAPIAGALGFSAEDTAEAIGLMANSGINTITGVHPYWVDSETQEVMELPEKVVLMSKKFVPYQKITVLDCTSDFQEKPTEDALREFAQNYIDTTDLTEPEIDIKIDFVQLWNTPGYEDIVEAERVSLCDTVHVYISKLGIEVSSKVTETEYDSLLERYNSITLSNSTVSSQNSSLTGSLNSIRNTATIAYDTAIRAETAVGEQVGGITASIIYDGTLFAALFGLHYKNETDSKGNTVRYAFNARALSQSTVAWKNSSAGLFVSTDGGKTWGYGWESDDTADKTAILLEQTLKELDDRYKKATELSEDLLKELDERYKTSTAISAELQKTLDQRYETAKKLSKELYEELDKRYGTGNTGIPVSETTPEAPAVDTLWVDKKNLRLKLWDGEQWQTVGYEPEKPDPEPTDPEPTEPTEPEIPDTEDKEEGDTEEGGGA